MANDKIKEVATGELIQYEINLNQAQSEIDRLSRSIKTQKATEYYLINQSSQKQSELEAEIAQYQVELSQAQSEIDRLARSIKTQKAIEDYLINQSSQKQSELEAVADSKHNLNLIDNTDLIVGCVIGHIDGFGFVRPDDSSDDVYLAPYEMNMLLHNDRAIVRIVGIDRRGRREGTVVEILERNTHQVLGRLYTEDGFVYVIPDNRNIAQTVLIENDKVAGAKHGQIVVAQITQQPTKFRQPIGHIIKVFGDHLSPSIDQYKGDSHNEALNLQEQYEVGLNQATS